mmetsp:Transcript_519/g.470  ORF Transcript_519/g.470 Transcript_519/m.470 type:complete len:93 (+) Transcript_519:56-334(+)
MNSQAKYNKLYLNVTAYLPMGLLFGIIGYLYIVYMVTYLVPLMSGSYDFREGSTENEGKATAMLITMKTLTKLSNSMASTFTSKDVALSDDV